MRKHGSSPSKAWRRALREAFRLREVAQDLLPFSLDGLKLRAEATALRPQVLQLGGAAAQGLRGGSLLARLCLAALLEPQALPFVGHGGHGVIRRRGTSALLRGPRVATGWR